MLEVLVGKTIEQALLEVMEEEELANLRAHQYAFEELRNAELAEVQRLEEQERRHREEKVWSRGSKPGLSKHSRSSFSFTDKHIFIWLYSSYKNQRNAILTFHTGFV